MRGVCNECGNRGKIRNNEWDSIKKTYTFGFISCKCVHGRRLSKLNKSNKLIKD